MNATKWILTAAIAAISAAPAPAAFVTSLYGTGLNNDGTARTNNQTELHYAMLAGSPVVGTPVVYTDAGGFPVATNWLNDASSATSRWIAPTTVRNHPAGDYTFRTTFDLTGFLPGTASITGKWATDNQGVRIILNGNTVAGTSNGFTAYSTFNTSNGSFFVAGTNTLDFVVRNFAGGGTNPAGLRVEVTGDATVAAVPVPPTALLAVVGFWTVGLGRIVRRRRG